MIIENAQLLVNEGKIKLAKGVVFADMKHFRQVLREFAIQEGFNLVRVKNEKARITGVCEAKDCPCRVHASPTFDGLTFKINSYNSTHTCDRLVNVTEASFRWIAKKFKVMITATPDTPIRVIADKCRRSMGLNALILGYIGLGQRP